MTYPSTSSGATDVEIVIEASGTRASVVQRLDLPAATSAAGKAAPAEEYSGSGGATWVFALGAALVGIALLLALAGVFVFRAPRARGLNLPGVACGWPGRPSGPRPSATRS